MVERGPKPIDIREKIFSDIIDEAIRDYGSDEVTERVGRQLLESFNRVKADISGPKDFLDVATKLVRAFTIPSIMMGPDGVTEELSTGGPAAEFAHAILAVISKRRVDGIEIALSKGDTTDEPAPFKKPDTDKDS